MRAIRNPADAAKFAASVIRRHVPDPAYRVFLFGSRATGSAGERSDIDIGIEGPAPVSRAALAAIRDELEPRQLPIAHAHHRHRRRPPQPAKRPRRLTSLLSRAPCRSIPLSHDPVAGV